MRTRLSLAFSLNGTSAGIILLLLSGSAFAEDKWPTVVELRGPNAVEVPIGRKPITVQRPSADLEVFSASNLCQKRQCSMSDYVGALLHKANNAGLDRRKVYPAGHGVYSIVVGPGPYHAVTKKAIPDHCRHIPEGNAECPSIENAPSGLLNPPSPGKVIKDLISQRCWLERQFHFILSQYPIRVVVNGDANPFPPNNNYGVEPGSIGFAGTPDLYVLLYAARVCEITGSRWFKLSGTASEHLKAIGLKFGERVK